MYRLRNWLRTWRDAAATGARTAAARSVAEASRKMRQLLRASYSWRSAVGAARLTQLRAHAAVVVACKSLQSKALASWRAQCSGSVDLGPSTGGGWPPFGALAILRGWRAIVAASRPVPPTAVGPTVIGPAVVKGSARADETDEPKATRGAVHGITPSDVGAATEVVEIAALEEELASTRAQLQHSGTRFSRLEALSEARRGAWERERASLLAELARALEGARRNLVEATYQPAHLHACCPSEPPLSLDEVAALRRAKPRSGAALVVARSPDGAGRVGRGHAAAVAEPTMSLTLPTLHSRASSKRCPADAIKVAAPRAADDRGAWSLNEARPSSLPLPSSAPPLPLPRGYVHRLCSPFVAAAQTGGR